MVPVTSHERETWVFLFIACLVIFLLLLVVVPAQSQAPSVPQSNAVEIVDYESQFSSAWFLTIFTLLIVLSVFMLSYLKAAIRHDQNTRAGHPHWWSHVRLHH